MKNKKIKYGFLLFLGLGSGIVNAQQASVASGGVASGSGGSVSFSIGQVVYTTNHGATGTVAQGVQQPYEISQTTGIAESKNINLQVSAYPNPTIDFLTLQVSNLDLKNVSYQLIDMNGRLIETKLITSNEMSITMSNLIAATYFLKVTSNNKEVTTFKIIKN